MNNVLDKTFYCCTKYRKFGKEGCSAHTIEARTVHEVVLADIQKHAGQALADRKAMVTEIAERLNLQMSADREQQKKELRQCKQRVSEIENLYAKLYEDLTRELLTEKRFQMLSARYDSEQEELTAKIKELEKSAIADKVDGQKTQRPKSLFKIKLDKTLQPDYDNKKITRQGSTSLRLESVPGIADSS